MIQRLQTLFLLLAIALLVAFMFVPFGYVEILTGVDGTVITEPLKAKSELAMMIPICVAILLMVVAIFLFKKLSVQKLFTLFAMLLTGAVVILTVYVLVSGMKDVTPGDVVTSVVWGGGGLLALAAFISEVMAYRGISSDQRLLRSYDSFR